METEITTTPTLANLQTYLSEEVKKAGEYQLQHGGAMASVEHQIRLHGLLVGSPEEVEKKLAAWYAEEYSVYEGEFFDRVGDFLLSTDRITQKRKMPANKIPEDASVEEIVATMRTWLEDATKGTPDARTFWQGIVERHDAKSA